jgi:hypothetical protein
MGRSHRRRRLTLVAVVVICVITVGAIAAAGRAATPPRVQVSSAVSPDTTSAGASEATAADTEVASTPTSELTTGAPLVDGTYFGVEHFALFTGRCAFLDHHIVGTFDVSDGTTWDFHQDYCGTLQGDLWSGVGTFALTAPDGAAITGTVTERNIRVPSPGVPYTLDITGGTQRFASATGTCRLDNHLRQIQFGLQDDFGSFTCDIAV